MSQGGKRLGFLENGGGFPRIECIPLFFCPYMGFPNMAWYQMHDGIKGFLQGQGCEDAFVTCIVCQHDRT